MTWEGGAYARSRRRFSPPLLAHKIQPPNRPSAHLDLNQALADQRQAAATSELCTETPPKQTPNPCEQTGHALLQNSNTMGQRHSNSRAPNRASPCVERKRKQRHTRRNVDTQTIEPNASRVLSGRGASTPCVHAAANTHTQPRGRVRTNASADAM